MGNVCIKASSTIEFETEIFDKSWFSKCLQHDLLAAQYTNVKSVNVVDGCTTAIARRSSPEGRSQKVFIKCHINLDALRFDSDRARLEVDLLNKLSHDAILSPHLPRLERTTWLDSHAQNSRSIPVSESRSGGGGKISAAGGQPVPSHILLLEFERSAGNLLAQQVDEGLRLSERQAAEMASQLLRIISALHAHQLCHGHIGGSSLVLTDGPPAPRREPPALKAVPRDSSPPAPVPPGNVSSLSPPTSGISATEDSDCESDDGMSSWLLPGYPQGVDHPDMRKTKTAHHQHTPGSPSDASRRASNVGVRTPPRRCEGGAVSEATPVGESRDRRHSTPGPSPASSKHHRTPPARNTLSVNETFEGLASASAMSAISTRMVIPIRSMRHEIEQWSASESVASPVASADVPSPVGGRAAPAAPGWHVSPLMAAGPVAEGAEGGAAALGGTSSISWDAQVSDMIDQQLDMFAPASAALGLMPSIANEPGMYKAAASAFEDGSDKGRAAGEPGDDSDAQMNTRWSFEADAAPEIDEAEVARVFGEEPERTVRPPLPPVRTTSRASSNKAPRKAPTRAHVQSSATRRQLYDAVMEAGAEKYTVSRGKSAARGECQLCAEMRQVCADCRLRGANQRMSRGRDRRTQPGPADAGKRRAGKPAGGPVASARQPVSGESGVHVVLHLHGVEDMPVVGGARLFAIHKDIAAAGAALLLAVTGEDTDVYHLQRALETKRPVSRRLAWTMLSADARDFVEGLIGERLGLEDAYQHPWMRQHLRRAAQAGPERTKSQPRKSAQQPAVVVPEPTLKSARRKSPLSVASSAHPSSPLTIQPVRKPSPGMAAQHASSGPASPRLPRRESGVSIAQSRNPSQKIPSRRASQNSLAREPPQGAPPRDPSQGSLSKNPSNSNLARAESSGGSARFRPSDSMSLIAPHRTGSGSAPTPPRVPSEPNIAGPALAQRITEERVDESGKKHVVTRFVLPPRAPSNAAQQLGSDAGGTPPAASMQGTDAPPSAPASARFSGADHSSEVASGAVSTESSAGLLSQPLLLHGERSDMLPPPAATLL